jgi:hypothetical protein
MGMDRLPGPPESDLIWSVVEGVMIDYGLAVDCELSFDQNVLLSINTSIVHPSLIKVK